MTLGGASAWLVATALCSGCLILPKTKTTRRQVGVRTEPPRPGAAGPLTLSARARGATLSVVASRARTCVQETFVVFEVKRVRNAKVAAAPPPKEPYGAALWMLAAPVTGTVSGLITAIILAAGDSTSVERSEQPGVARRRPCPLPAPRRRVSLALPSGAALEGITDARGRVVFAIPDTEPASGTAIARTPGVRATSFFYGTPPKPLRRDEVRAALAEVAAPIRQCGGAGRQTAMHTLALEIDGGVARLRPTARLSPGVFGCVDAALQRAIFRAAPRLRVLYPFRLGPSTLARQPARETCDSYLRRWREEKDLGAKTLLYDGLPPSCQGQVTRVSRR